MEVRVDHVLHRLARHLLELRHDVRVIDLELVVHEDDSRVGDERSGVPGDEVVVDDVDVIRHFDEIELGRFLPELRVKVRTEHGKREHRDETDTHLHQASPTDS